MAWRNAHSLTTLLTEINTLFPGRAKGTDGGISGYTYGPGGVVVNPYNYSGHNINARGVICAFDITTGDRPGGISTRDGQALTERIRIAMRDQPRGQTPYVIHWMAPPYVAVAGPKIASAYDNWEWHRYYGDDDHKSHIHPSVDWDIPHGGAPSAAAYDITLSWNLGTITGQGSGITPIQEDTLSQAEVNQITKALTAERITIVREIRAGNVQVGDTVRAEAYSGKVFTQKVDNANADRVIIDHRAQIAGLTEAIKQLATDTPMDLDAITEAARRGAEKAMAEGIVKVDISIDKPTPANVDEVDK